MFNQEWPLMMFTLVSQVAIGSFFMLILIRTLLNRQEPEQARVLTQWGLFWVGPVMALSLLLSIFHLGTPFGAYRSILNVGSSWLSREILTAGGFFFLWLVFSCVYRKEGNGLLLGWLTNFVGLSAVFSMASIYDNTVRPAWSNLDTFLAFYGATLVLGTVGAGLCLAIKLRKENLAKTLPILKKLAFVGVLGVVVPLIYFPIFVATVSQLGVAGASSAALLAGPYAPITVVRWLLSVAGIALYFWFLYGKKNSILSARWVYLSFALVLLGEFLGRYTFYGAAVSITIGKF